jgi:hypothetical protein
MMQAITDDLDVDPYSVTRFEDFWPHYVRLHSKPETQWCHAAATMTSTVLFALAISRKSLFLAVIAPLANHAIAQTSHRLFEKNKSTPWKNQIWHTRAEFKMLTLVLTGKMAAEADRFARPCPRAA